MLFLYQTMSRISVWIGCLCIHSDPYNQVRLDIVPAAIEAVINIWLELCIRSETPRPLYTQFMIELQWSGIIWESMNRVNTRETGEMNWLAGRLKVKWLGLHSNDLTGGEIRQWKDNASPMALLIPYNKGEISLAPDSRRRQVINTSVWCNMLPWGFIGVATFDEMNWRRGETGLKMGVLPMRPV